MTDAGSAVVEETLVRKSTDLTIYAEKLEFAPWVYFWMAATYPNKGGKKQGEYLKFDKKAGEFDLTFRLADDSGLHLKFCRPFANAMYVSEGPTCPPPGPGDGDRAIRDGHVENDLEITAVNVNGTPQLLTFMLRFDGDSKEGVSPPYLFDPKIINGGG